MSRPRIEINYELVEDLARIQCTEHEIQTVACKGIKTKDGWTKRKAQDPRLCEALERGRADGSTSLRRRQFQVADEGNPTMLIWLGKNYLGQRESPEDMGVEGSLLGILQAIGSLREDYNKNNT